MKKRANWDIRSADPQDRRLITALLSVAHWKHQHLDWFNSYELLGKPPYLLTLERGTPIACLASPTEPPLVAWLRLFAVSGRQRPSELWAFMWPKAANQAAALGAKQAAVLLQSDWLTPMLVDSGFEHVNTVVVLERRMGTRALHPKVGHAIRPMRREDLPQVAHIDGRAFQGVWMNSLQALQLAWGKSALASVALDEERPVAYQISTASPYGIHLARLAVDPDFQRAGIGKALVHDLLWQVARQGHRRLTVNTQADNQRALDLYQELAFRETGERFPVYQKDLGGP